MFVFFFFKQKTAYEMRISDWSSDVCSSDLGSAQRFELSSPWRRRASSPSSQPSTSRERSAASRRSRRGVSTDILVGDGPRSPASNSIVGQESVPQSDDRRARRHHRGNESAERVGHTAKGEGKCAETRHARDRVTQ